MNHILWTKYNYKNISMPSLFTKDSFNYLLLGSIPNNLNEDRTQDQTDLINLGADLQVIPDEAFKYCDLTNISIPSSVTTIGQRAFSFNKLKNLIIPYTVKIIDEFAFAYNELNNIILPDSITTIKFGTFLNNHLRNAIIPFTVTSIESYAFSDNRLENIKIPSSVTTIGMCVFDNNELSNIIIPSWFQSKLHIIFTSYETIDFVNFDYESRMNFIRAIEGSYELTIEGKNDFSNKARFLTNTDLQKELLQYF